MEDNIHSAEHPPAIPRRAFLQHLGVAGSGRGEGAAHRGDEITNAVYHATGVRVRKLPVTVEDLLAAG